MESSREPRWADESSGTESTTSADRSLDSPLCSEDTVVAVSQRECPSNSSSGHTSPSKHSSEDSDNLPLGNLKVELPIKKDRGTQRKRFLIFPNFTRRLKDLHLYEPIVSKFLRDKMSDKIDKMIEAQDAISSYAIGFESPVWSKSLRVDPEKPVIQRYKISGTQAQYENFLANHWVREKGAWNALSVFLSPVVSTSPLAPEMETLAQAFFRGQGIPEVIHITDEVKGGTAPNHTITYNTGYWSTILGSDLPHDPVIAPFLLQIQANNEMEECVRKGRSYFGMRISRSDGNEILRLADHFNSLRKIKIEDYADIEVFRSANSLYYVYVGGVRDDSTKDGTESEGESVHTIEEESDGETGSVEGVVAADSNGVEDKMVEDEFKGDKANGNTVDDGKANGSGSQGKKSKRSKKLKKVDAEEPTTKNFEQSEDDKADVSKKPKGSNNDDSTKKKRRRAKKKPKKDDSWIYDTKPETKTKSHLETKTKSKKKTIKTKKEATSAEAPGPLEEK